MSYNDRLREASVWVAAHPGETVSVPKADLAEALWDAAELRAQMRDAIAAGKWSTRERETAMTRNTSPDARGCPESDEQAVRALGDGSGSTKPAERQP